MKKVCIVGGDSRLKTVKHHLEKQNFFVNTLGLYPEDKGDIALSDILILPVPTTRDGKNVFTPLTNRVIPLEDIYKKNNYFKAKIDSDTLLQNMFNIAKKLEEKIGFMPLSLKEEK